MLLTANRLVGADAVKKRQGVGVAAEQDVLAIVNELAGLTIAERRGASAQPAAGFEDQHAGAPRREANGRAQSRETGADDNRVVARQPSSHCLIAMSA